MDSSDRLILITGVRPPLSDRPGNFAFHTAKRFIELGYKVFVHARTLEYLEALHASFTAEEMEEQIVMRFGGDLTDFSTVKSMAKLVRSTLSVMSAGAKLHGVVLTPGPFPQHPEQLVSQGLGDRLHNNNFLPVALVLEELFAHDCMAADAVVLTCSVVGAGALTTAMGHQTCREYYLWVKQLVEDETRRTDANLRATGGRAFSLVFGVLENTPKEWWPKGFDPRFLVPMDHVARQVEVLIHFRVWPEGIRVVLDGGWTVQPGDGFWG